MTPKWQRILRQKTTWLGITGLVVMALETIGLEVDDGTREAITEALLIISGLVLVLVDPKDTGEDHDGDNDSDGGRAGPAGRLGGTPAVSARPGQGSGGSGGESGGREA